MATRIPEGFVLVSPRSRETATALLEAADKIKADRRAGVRTVLNGYHVAEDIAEEFQKSFPEAEIEEPGKGDSNDPADEALPVTADSTHAEIDEYAATLDPAVTFPKDAKKDEKIAILEEARAPKTEDAE